jgi:SlyX protein
MSSERIDRLEERLAWLERHVTAQDKEMHALHETVARLRRELDALRTRPAGDEPFPPSLADPAPARPPHY